MKRLALIGVVAVMLVSGAGLVAASATGPAPEGPVEVRLTIRHSRFVPAAITLPAGRSVRFVVDNTDPIAHELIIGGRSVQDKHERGTHAVHGALPGEVSVPPGEVRTTTYDFDSPGEVLMGCHLPGHWDYGMQGVISVV